MNKNLKLLVESLFKDIYPLNEKFGSTGFANLIKLCKENIKGQQAIRLIYYNANGPVWLPIATLKYDYSGKFLIDYERQESTDNSWFFKFIASIGDEFIYANKCLTADDLSKYDIKTADNMAIYLHRQKVNNVGVFAVMDNYREFWFNYNMVSNYQKEAFEKLKKSKIIGAVIIKNDDKILEPLKKFNDKAKQRAEYKKEEPINILDPKKYKDINLNTEKKKELYKKILDLKYYQTQIDRFKNYYTKKYNEEYCKQLNDIIVGLSKKSEDLKIFKEAEEYYLKSCGWDNVKTSDEKSKSYFRCVLWGFISDYEGHGWIQKDITGTDTIIIGVLSLFLNNKNYFDWWKNFYLTFNPQGMYVKKFQ